MLKKLIKLNLDDLLLYLGVEGGLFLAIQVIIGCIMRFGRPSDSITVGCVVFPIVGGFTALVAGISHVGVSFEQALRFGQTRRRALGLILGLMSFETAFALALGGLLAAAEWFLCVPLWAKLAGMSGWTMGHLRFTPEGAAVNGVPAPGNVLLIETFTLDWYWWLLIFVLAIAGGILAGALLQRFGGKGGWIIWGACMAPMILGQLLPWESLPITGLLLPAAAVLLIGGFLWAVWSLLHAAVRA